MDRFPDRLIGFQRMFPDEAACAAWLELVRWPEGFECPRCGRDQGWALRGKAHSFECADLGDGRDDLAWHQARARDLVLGDLSDGDALDRHFGAAAPESTRHRLLERQLIWR